MGRRRTCPAALVALALTLTLAPGALGATAEPANTRVLTSVDLLETQVLVELNTVRRAHGLTPLKLSRPLGAAADAHSRAMGTHGFFAHDSLDGTEFWQRVRRFYAPASGGAWSVAENLLWSSGSLDAKAAVRLWMGSPGHRKNILTARWREIGVSAVGVTGAPGVYGGHDVVIVTTDFGFRA